MKLRIEKEGYHYYDRDTGIHMLIDEVLPSPLEISKTPRTVSIALTNYCNSNCDFCHIEKGNDFLPKHIVFDICKILDKHGTLDIAFGGGEPLVHKEFVEICKSIWRETGLGVSVTTNGSLLNAQLIFDIKDFIGFIRVSIDTTDPLLFQSIRGFEFQKIYDNLKLLKGEIPFGLNIVINNQTIEQLDSFITFAQDVGCEEILLLPQFNGSAFCLTSSQWKQLEYWIIANKSKMPLRIMESARKMMRLPVLFSEDSYYRDYLYIDAQMNMKRNSFDKIGVKLTADKLEEGLTLANRESRPVLEQNMVPSVQEGSLFPQA